MQRFRFAPLLAMEVDRVSEMLGLLAGSAPELPCAYPDGEAGEFLRDPAKQPLSLLLGAIAMYGSEHPWALPHGMAARLGMARFDAPTLAAFGEQDLRRVVGEGPALHIDPRRMGRWAWRAARFVDGQYGGANWIWNDYRTMDAGRLVGRLMDVPGMGPVKATVLAFLLRRDWGARIVGWEAFEPPMDGGMLVAANRLGLGTSRGADPELVVRAYEGLRMVARMFCAGDAPLCGGCPLSEKCPRQGA